MRIFQPKRTPVKGVEGAETFSDNPLTPGNKTHKTPQTEVLEVLLPPPQGVSENLEGVSTPQGDDGPSQQISPDSHPEESPTSDDRRTAELVARYQAGQFSPKVRARLAEIFEQNPPDAEERVLKACEYLGITGEGLEEADRLACEVTQ